MGKRAGRRNRARRALHVGNHLPTDHSQHVEGGGPGHWDVGVVLVHGIGGQKPGDTLESWTPIIRGALGGVTRESGRTVSPLRSCSAPVGDTDAPAYEMTLERKGHATARVLVTEAHWADKYRSRRLLGTLPWVARIGPALILPFLPDARDRHSAGWQLAIRLLMRILSPFMVLTLIMALPRGLQLAATALTAAALLMMVTNQRFNLAGHVQMAAEDDAALAAVQEHLTMVVESTRQVSTKTLVIAHSQGGYLAHRTLRDLPTWTGTLISLGSGLRPITALRVMGSRPAYVVGCWAALIGTLLTEIWLLTHFDPGQVVSPFRQMGIDEGLLFMALVVGVVPTDLWDSATPLGTKEAVVQSLPRLTLDWWFVCAAGAFLTALLIVRLWGDEFTTAMRIAPLRRTDWTDITTHHDLVGRLTVPPLPPSVDEKAVIIHGNALMDHTRYLNTPGITAWLVADRIANMVGFASKAKIETSRRNALARSTRRHDLRIAAVAAPLSLVGLTAILDGRDPLGSMIAAVPHLAWVFLLLSLFVWFTDTKDSRDVAAELHRRTAPRPVPKSVTRRPADAAILVVVTMTAMLSSLAVGTWSQELNLLHADILVEMFVVWFMSGLGLAAAVAAGYRPPAVWVTTALVAVSLVMALPTWLSAGPTYPAHFAPLGLPALAAMAIYTFVGLFGLGRLWAGLRRLPRSLARQGRGRA